MKEIDEISLIFQSLSLLVDTSGGFKAAKIEILILDDYSVELK